jgi:excisionase family DNA binding protein
MLQRCTNPNNSGWKNYGGRGINVCERWRSFENFFADMGVRPSPEFTIDRFPNNNGDYEPTNCRWATRLEQGRSTRRVKLSVERVQEIFLLSKQGASLRSIAQRFGVSDSTVSSVLNGTTWCPPGQPRKQPGYKKLMLVIGSNTAQALAPHTIEHSWVMFVQVASPGGVIGPIKIEGVRGSQVSKRLFAISEDNPYPAYLIGLVETPTPAEHAQAICEQYSTSHLHDGWFEPTPVLLQFIQHVGQSALASLIAATRPGGVPDAVVGIEEIATVLDVSVPTIRRLVTAGAIPHFRVGRQLRFVVEDVLASMNRG